MAKLTNQQRKYVVDQVNANAAIEGLTPDARMREIQAAYAGGKISSEQMIAAMRAHLQAQVEKAGGEFPPDTLQN